MKMRKLVVMVALLASIACVPPRPPTVPPPTTAALAVVATSEAMSVEGATVKLHTGEVCTTNADGYCLFAGLIVGERGITVTHPKYLDAFAEAKPFEANMTVIVELVRAKPPMGRIAACGKNFCEEGTANRWHWRGVDAFSLAFDIATGQSAKVDDFLQFAQDERVSVLRVFTTAVLMFDLDPATGRMAAIEVLERTLARGLRVELVGIADSNTDPNHGPVLRAFNHQEHIHALGQLCASYVNCFLEIANEPNHETQDPMVRDVAYLRGLKALVPEHVMVTLGASHGSDDENPIYWIDSDYAVVHSERKGGWDSVRHTREIQWLRDSGQQGTGKPAVSDEPDRNLTVDQHAGMGLQARLFSFGDTVHLLPLMRGQVPTGDDMLAFRARRDGWDAFPHEFEGRYYNPSTIGGGPIRSFDPSQIVRLYGALAGGQGYIVGLGVTTEASIQWQWEHDKLVEVGQARLFFTRQ